MKINDKLKFLLHASIASFGAYFCMYAFRKPFTVATYEGLEVFNIDYKILIIIFQVIGYTISKFLGIKIIAEMKSAKRLMLLIGFILFAELALLGFALVPPPYNVVFMFLNGMPLGMIWGIVFSYLEGRKATEVLGVILCASFIVSSGVVKSIGKFTMDMFGVSEFWMPFVTGLFFIIPLVFFGYLLERLPEPSEADKESRSARKPLNRSERLALYKTFAFPLTLIVVFYVFITAARDFRDNFAREIWDVLGYEDSVGIYSYSEIPIAVLVLVILGLIGTVSKNYKAFLLYHLTLFLGGVLLVVSTFLFHIKVINPIVWMVISGFSMYICYIPFQGLFFDRMIATFKINGNVGFLIYIADAFGYLGSVLVLLYKNFGKGDISYLLFFEVMAYLIAVLAITIAVLSYLFFRMKHKKSNLSITSPVIGS